MQELRCGVEGVTVAWWQEAREWLGAEWEAVSWWSGVKGG